MCVSPRSGVLSLGSGALVLSVLSLVMDGDQAGDQGPGPVTVLVTITVRKLGLSIITDH